MRRLRGWGHCAERWGWDRHRNKERESWGHVPSECPGHFPSDSLSYPKLHHPSPKPQDFFFHLRQLVLEFLSLATQSLDEQKYSVSFLLYITLFVFLKILRISDIIWYSLVRFTSLSMVISGSIHVAANGIISFFLMALVIFHYHCIYLPETDLEKECMFSRGKCGGGRA